MTAYSEFERWKKMVTDSALAKSLKELEADKAGVEDSFSKHLEFGTAGMRGVLAPGTNRMNLYSVRRATEGLADYIKTVDKSGSAAVAYDSRNMSREFAGLTARVLASRGVKVYLYPRLMPVPMLSYAVRELHCTAGVMITASHNPAEYNGYKVYGSDGCQMTDEAAAAVLGNINKHDYFETETVDELSQCLDDSRIEYISQELCNAYYEDVLKLRAYPEAPQSAPVKIVYSPLNGAGNEPVREVLKRCGHSDVTVVAQQELPDGNFPTCPYPNPETAGAREMGLELAKREAADIFIATDPDCDRVGVCFPEKDGNFRSLTGNEAGVLMLDYIIRARKEKGSLPERPIAVRSIVSSRLADRVAAEGGVEMREVLTGFKYIGEQILRLEQQGETHRFLFGFEESCGYLSGGFVRDKDGVFAAMLLCELTSYCKRKGTTPLAVLDHLYETYGYFKHRVCNLSFPGVEGAAAMKSAMNRLRDNAPGSLAGFAVTETEDYLKGIRTGREGKTEKLELPSSDVLSYKLENGASVIVRPSGTEPKIKFYITACEATEDASDCLGEQLEAAIRSAAGI